MASPSLPPTVDDFTRRLADMRSWLVLLAQVHLDRCHARQEASNVAHEVLVDALKYRDRVAALPAHELEAWLRHVLRNKIIDAYRQPRFRHEQDLRRAEAQVNESFYRLDLLARASHTSPSQQLIKQESLTRLAAAIEQLPPTSREVIVLKELAGYTIAEVADRLSCTLGVIAGRLRRGREQLAKLLE